METLYERITHWKKQNEWEAIQEVFSQATTLDWHYQIVTYVKQNKAKYGHRYREKILAEEAFIAKFGHHDLDYLKNAQKTMNKKCYKWR
jgi:hypothetical protein